MTTRGGRESGGHAGSQPDPVARGSVSAAANPVSLDHKAVIQKDLHDNRTKSGTCLEYCEARTYDEHIRALEDAERTCKAANESQRKTIAALEAELAERPLCPCPGCKEDRCGDCDEWGCNHCLERRLARIRALEAELAERDKVLATYQRWAMDAGRTSLAARAEKAEAELQRLADEGLTIEERDARVVEQRKAAEKLVLEFKAEVERLKAENAAIIYRPKMRGPIVDASATNPDDREPVERERLERCGACGVLPGEPHEDVREGPDEPVERECGT